MNANAAAFPQLHTIDGNWVKNPEAQYAGLTKREWLAGMALSGLCSEALSTRLTKDEQDRLAKQAVWIGDEVLRYLEDTKK